MGTLLYYTRDLEQRGSSNQEHGGPRPSIRNRVYPREALGTGRLSTTGEVLQTLTGDVLLPDQDGYALLEQLKADPATHPIPVLIVSIVSDDSRGRLLGAAGYLTKPIAVQALLGKRFAIDEPSPSIDRGLGPKHAA